MRDKNNKVGGGRVDEGEWSADLRANMLRYNGPFYELAEILEQLEQKKGVIDRYGRYKPTVTTTSAGRI